MRRAGVDVVAYDRSPVSGIVSWPQDDAQNADRHTATSSHADAVQGIGSDNWQHAMSLKVTIGDLVAEFTANAEPFSKVEKVRFRPREDV